MKQNLIVSVAVASIFWEGLDYLIPDNISAADLTPGVRVVVPFGRRQLVGMVLSTHAHSTLAREKLKSVAAVLDQHPLVDSDWIKLMTWISDYYHYPLGSTIMSAFPKRLRENRAADEVGLPTPAVSLQAPAYTLSDEQVAAISAIQAQTSFQTFLLHGVTGSGKTEVYMQVIIERLSQQQQVLVLVPEIGLTPQTLTRFEQRFSVPVVALHSNLAAGVRAKNWLMARQPIPMIVIGTRSAVFAPFANLGMIIVDEEHDLSFKQQSGLRYSARDVAVKRAHLLDIPVVLGSATPSLETLYKANQGSYLRLDMCQRVGAAELPKMTLLDMRGQKSRSGLSELLIQKVQATLDSGRQVLLFLNRRGYAPVLMCHHCGWVVECSSCESSLVLHKSENKLQCHQCDRQSRVVKYCQQCKQSELAPVGYGTQRLDEDLSDLFADYPIIRVDRDSTRRKHSMQKMLDEIKQNSAAILLGTQMLAKGHHFPNLSLVVMLDVDGGLLSIDFRAEERLAQLICQVAGRAGRSDHLGEVIIQTHHPEHALYQALLQGKYQDYIANVLQQRADVSLPPIHFMALLSAESKRYEQSEHFLHEVKQSLMDQSIPQLKVLGPVVAPLSKRRGHFRAQLLLSSTGRSFLHQAIRPVVRELSKKSSARQVRWSIDVDPMDLL